MKRYLFALPLALGLLATLAAVTAQEPSLEGQVTHVRDGDTIEIGRVAIRLRGVAAPERGEPLGRRATARMKELALGSRVTCEPDGSRSYDRIVAVCYLGGVDVGEVLIREGLARDCPRFSRGRYGQAEEAAAAAGAQIRKQYRLPGYCRAR
ncbi:thermonuclease family protein [Geminicoccaceae bacterium 1502E]|nr:thermonuclease family protein [Geminicoccaceae bacterium 1502E]